MGLSKQEFAKAMKVGPPLITMWERGNYSTQPSQRNIDRLCKLAEITLPRFWGRLPRAKKRARA